MLLTNAVALSLYRLNGRFNMFHAYALVSLAATVAALMPVLRHASGWLVRHQWAMQGAYIGLCAAAVNEILTWMISQRAPLSHQAFWFLGVCITLAVIASGAAMARRGNRPCRSSLAWCCSCSSCDRWTSSGAC